MSMREQMKVIVEEIRVERDREIIEELMDEISMYRKLNEMEHVNKEDKHFYETCIYQTNNVIDIIKNKKTFHNFIRKNVFKDRY